MQPSIMLTGTNAVTMHGYAEDLHYESDRLQVKFDAVFNNGIRMIATIDILECSFMSVDDYNFITISNDGDALTFCVESTTWDHTTDDFPFVVPVYQ